MLCRSIKFISTDFNQMNTLINSGNTFVQYQITTSVVHPLRVWLLGYPVVSGTTVPGGATFSSLQCLQRPWYAPGVVLGFFTQDNMQVNNINYFRQNLQTIQDHVSIRTHSQISVCLFRLLLMIYLCSMFASLVGILARTIQPR